MSSLNALAASLSPRPHIIAITETWFVNEECCTILDGYQYFGRARDGHGGGVAFFIDTNVTTFEVESPPLLSKDVEQIWLGIQAGDEKLLFGCIYRPPPTPQKSADETNKRAKLEQAVINSIVEAKRLVEKGAFSGLCGIGDFNFNKTSWDSDGVGEVRGGPSVIDHKFVEALEEHHIFQAVAFPSFQNARGKRENFLDLVLCESQNRVFNVEEGPPLSDESEQYHVSITFDVSVCSGFSKPYFERSSFNFSKGDYVRLSDELEAIDWTSLLAGKEINECYSIFTKEYEIACNLWIPKMNRLTRKVQPPWMNDALACLIAKKKRLWILVQQTRSRVASIRQEYKSTCKEVKKATKRSVIEYEKRLINDKKNSKRLFSYAKSKQRTSSTISSLNVSNGTTTNSGDEISNILNAYFKSVFVVEDNETELPAFEKRTQASISSATLDVNDISTRISLLDPYKAPGGDGVHPHVLMKCHSACAIPLAKIFFLSLRDGKIPDEWRLANVTPLHKKGSRLDPGNYRPISLTSVTCKVMERIIRDTVLDHMYANQLVAKQQHGFVRSKACNTNLLESMDAITSSLAYKRWVDVIFLDFAKAFDKVPHRRLLCKLEAYGIHGSLLKWLEDFLKDRKQRVVMGNHVSSWEAVTSGVPQGSVLGPILFVIYINDMPTCVSNHLCKLYADDSKIIAEINNTDDSRKLQDDIDSIVEWTDVWLMRLNYDKCKVMHIGRGNPKNEYTLRDSSTGIVHKLIQTETERDLGITLSSDVKWHAHATKIASKANSLLGWMKNAFMCREAALWKTLYTTYIRPHLEFAAPVWGLYHKGDIERVERVQRRATRVAHDLKRYDYPKRLQKLGLTTLEERRLRGDCIQQFKILTSRDEVHWISTPRSTEPMRGRRAQLRREHVTSCSQRENFFTNRIVNRWNELPDALVQATSLNSFKNAYDKFKQPELN